MKKQLLHSVIAKYGDLSVSRRSIIWSIILSNNWSALATDKSRYFAQPRPMIVNYHIIIVICEMPSLALEINGEGMIAAAEWYHTDSANTPKENVNLPWQLFSAKCSSRSSLGIASLQRGHWANLSLDSHSVSRCSLTPEISITWERWEGMVSNRSGRRGEVNNQPRSQVLSHTCLSLRRDW